MSETTVPKIPFHVAMEFTYGEPREIWPGVRRIVANNPGGMTDKGTNTYIVGTGDVAVIDPGPDNDDHIKAILKALENETISHILLTHTHKDHSTGIAKLQAATGAKLVAHAQIHENRGARHSSDDPLDDGFVDFSISPDMTIKEGDVVEGKNWQLKAIHTPGHAPDHLCFAHLSEPILFTGDHIMAWNTSVIIPPEGRMSDYLNSLTKLIGHNYQRLLPGHGGQARNPDRLIKAFLMHRKWREEAILDHIRNGLTSIDGIVPLLYPNIEAGVQFAASLSVLAHAEHLNEQGLIKANSETLALNSHFTAN